MDATGSLIAAAVVLPLLYFLFRRPRAAAGRRPGGADPATDAADGLSDLDAAFMARAEAGGEEAVDAIAVMTIADLPLVRSLLAAAGIANFAKNDHMSSLIPGVGLEGLNPMTITVFRSDVQAAEEIYAAYLSKQRAATPPDAEAETDRETAPTDADT